MRKALSLCQSLCSHSMWRIDVVLEVTNDVIVWCVIDSAKESRGKCVPPLGMGFTHPKLHVTLHVTLHYTSPGPIAGLAMDAFGSEPATTP
eukprot:m.24439 g.24439  ORF g.24439 m.24439 type:complete len:91 (-) comp6075_c0_seq1:690-962(-)